MTGIKNFHNLIEKSQWCGIICGVTKPTITRIHVRYFSRGHITPKLLPIFSCKYPRKTKPILRAENHRKFAFTPTFKVFSALSINGEIKTCKWTSNGGRAFENEAEFAPVIGSGIYCARRRVYANDPWLYIFLSPRRRGPATRLYSPR